MSDNVKHPDHYTSGGIECIDAIRASLGCDVRSVVDDEKGVRSRSDTSDLTRFAENLFSRSMFHA
jgi:hypothetical protein